jgi:MYXO-CTERM domain-containing protein
MVTKRLISVAGVIALLVAVGGTASAFTTTQTQNQTTAGQDFTFTFANLPIAIGNATVAITLYGDYAATTEYADVIIDGAGQVQHQGSTSDCLVTGGLQNYTATAATINSDHQLVVNVNLSPGVSSTLCTAITPRVTVTVTYTSRPDLYVYSSSAPASGSTAGHGSQFTAIGNVRNLYENMTTDFSLRYYYCATNTYSASTCVFLSNNWVTDDFTPGQIRSYTSPTLTLPPTAEVGNRYIMLRADGTGTVTEADETNNDQFNLITVTTLPDLDITASTVPLTGSTNNPGAQFTAQYTVTNDDLTSAVTASFTMAYAYCPTCLSNTGCIALGTQTITQDIVSGGSYTFTSPSLTIPASATTGTHCIRATVDSGAAINESDENNNVDWDPINVGAGALPDLTADQLTVPVTGSVANAGAVFTMTSRINNNAAVAQNTDFAIYYYYCPTAVTTGCTYLTTQTVTTNLGANGNTIVTSPSLTMPTTAIYGTGQIRVFVDATSLVAEANETNNNTWKAISVTVKPDLTIAAVSVPYTGTTTGPGSTFTGRFTIQNKPSTSYVTNDMEVQYFYCPNNNPTGCISLGSDPITANFASGGSYTFTSSQLTIPAAASPGTHYIRAFVDSKSPQDVDESDETNNNTYAPITLTSGAADIYVKTFTATATGTTITYNVETCNKGGATSTAILVGLFYNRATAPTCADTADDSYTIAAGLGANLCNVHVFTRAGAPVGASTAWAMGDQGCAVSEGDETNNTSSVSVTVAQQPDQGLPPDTGVEPDYALKFDAVIPKPEASISDVGVPPDQSMTNPEATTKTDTTGPQTDSTQPTGDKGTPTGDSTTPTGDSTTPTGDKGTTPKADTGAKPPAEDGGCSCSIQGRDDTTFGLLGLLLGLALLARRRRRG